MPTLSETQTIIPEYGERPEKPGLYLALFHGRSHPKQQMNDWGFNGPLIGPLEWCHTTYATNIRVCFESPNDEAVYFSDPAYPEGQDIAIVGDLLCYGDAYYGDWTVFYVDVENTALPEDRFRNAKRRLSYGLGNNHQ